MLKLVFFFVSFPVCGILPIFKEIIDSNQIICLRYILDIYEINHQSENGVTALDEATRQGREHMVDMLLKHGAQVNYDNPYVTGSPPLFTAVAHRNLPIISRLLQEQACIESCDTSENTPLLLATNRPGNDNNDLIDLLLNAGANPNARNKDGHTPLRNAWRNQNTQVALLLLSWGAHPYMIDRIITNPWLGCVMADREVLKTVRDKEHYLEYFIGQGHDHIVHTIALPPNSSMVKRINKIMRYIPKQDKRYWNYMNCRILLENPENYSLYVRRYTEQVRYFIWWLRTLYVPLDVIKVMVYHSFKIPVNFADKIIDYYCENYETIHTIPIHGLKRKAGTKINIPI